MKKIRFPVVMFFSLFLWFTAAFGVLGISGVSNADDLKISELAKAVSDLKRETVVPDSEEKIATSGCCSWHGGVCDCILGRVICCDGTVSATCLCNRESNRGLIDAKKHP